MTHGRQEAAEHTVHEIEAGLEAAGVDLSKVFSDAAIEVALRYWLSSAPVESTYQKIRLIIGRSFGFHPAEANIVLAKLNLRGLCPPLPDRS